MATNPCKCGYFGDQKRECRCSPNDVQRYRDRISGPLLDYIDAVGVIRTAITHTEAGNRNPTLVICHALAVGLGETRAS